MYGFNYQPYQFNQQPQPQQDERIFVQNETSAEAYLVAPNGFVRLWDASRPVFYEKRADATGRPLPLECFEYERIQPQKASFNGAEGKDYQKEIDGILKRIEALEKERNYEHKSDADDSRIPEIQS